MLTRMYVDNFRCLVNFECRFGTQQLLLGPNGSGKSTLFDIFSALRSFCIHGAAPDELFMGRSMTRWQNIPNQSFELDVTGNKGEYQLRLVLDSWGYPERPRVILEEVTYSSSPIFRFEKGEVHLYNDDHEDKVQYPFDWHRSALATITERWDNTKLTWFKRWLDDLLIVSPDPRRMTGIAPSEQKTPDRFLADFASWYRHLRLEGYDSQHRDFIHDLRQVIEGFADIRMEDAGQRRREINVTIPVSPEDASDPRVSKPYLLEELSDGQRVLIGLYAILHFAIRPSVTLCFDEPDNFISLHEIQPWLTKLLDCSEENQPETQVLIASHHPELLNRMAFKEGLLLDRPEGRHVRGRAFVDPAGTGLSPSELVARGWERE